MANMTWGEFKCYVDAEISRLGANNDVEIGCLACSSPQATTTSDNLPIVVVDGQSKRLCIF